MAREFPGAFSDYKLEVRRVERRRLLCLRFREQLEGCIHTFGGIKSRGCCARIPSEAGKRRVDFFIFILPRQQGEEKEVDFQNIIPFFNLPRHEEEKKADIDRMMI